MFPGPEFNAEANDSWIKKQPPRNIVCLPIISGKREYPPASADFERALTRPMHSVREQIDEDGLHSPRIAGNAAHADVENPGRFHMNRLCPFKR